MKTARKGRKRCLAVLLTAVILVGLFVPSGVTAAQKPYLSLSVSSKAVSATSVKLKWKRRDGNIRSASKFRIYRSTSKKEYKTEKDYKLIRTVSGRTFSFTDRKLKTGTRYTYIVRAYKYIGGSLKLVGETNEEENVPGVGKPEWFEYQHSDTHFSPKQIELVFSVDRGLVPTGYEIYRKKPGEKYKKIKTIKKKKTSMIYIDRKVMPGQKYLYKVRAFRKYGKKKIYGKWSDSLKMSAVNYSGIFTSAVTDEDEANGIICVKLVSHKYNGDLKFNSSSLLQYDFDSDSSGGKEAEAALCGWSLDGNKWEQSNKDIILSGGQTIYLKFYSKNNVKLTADFLKSRQMICDDVTYNDLPAELTFRCGGSGTAVYNMEYIH